MEEDKNSWNIWTIKRIEKRHLGRRGHGWEDTTRMDLEKIVINTINCVDSAQGRGYNRIFILHTPASTRIFEDTVL